MTPSLQTMNGWVYDLIKFRKSKAVLVSKKSSLLFSYTTFEMSRKYLSKLVK